MANKQQNSNKLSMGHSKKQINQLGNINFQPNRKYRNENDLKMVKY